MAKILADGLDTSQLPSVFEYEDRSDSETLMQVRSDFTLKTGSIMEFGTWRVRASVACFYVEHYDGSAWVEQGRFEL
jgi:hypothetical protein